MPTIPAWRSRGTACVQGDRSKPSRICFMARDRRYAKVRRMSLVTNAVQQVKQLTGAFDVNAPGRNVIKSTWDTLAGLPGGKRAFSLLIGRTARYTGSIRARVVELRPGYARVEMSDSPLVRTISA